MLKLSAFADEISPQLDEQIRVCKENGVTHFELRGVYGKNVLDFDDALRREIKTKLADNGLAVAVIGSPIGKVTIDKPWPEHFDRFKMAVELAEYLGAPFIRLFSYYPAGGEGKGDLDAIRDEVIRRFREKVEYVKDRPVTLVHENERSIYGDIGRRCADLMKTIDSPRLRFAFDFANFVVCKDRPQDNWPALKPYTVHFHIKDAIMETGKIVPAGQGDGQLEPILKDAYASGYRGFVSLEPHLAAAAQFSGFSGPDLFKTAADALKDVCRRADIPLATGTK